MWYQRIFGIHICSGTMYWGRTKKYSNAARKAVTAGILQSNFVLAGYDELNQGSGAGDYSKGAYSGSTQAQTKSSTAGPGKGKSFGSVPLSVVRLLHTYVMYYTPQNHTGLLAHLFHTDQWTPIHINLIFSHQAHSILCQGNLSACLN